MNNDDNLDLLDLNDDTESMDNLPDAAPFAAPRPKKPWLLLGLGLLVIVLATYIIIRAIGGDSSSSMEVDLDAPAVIVDGEGAEVPVNVGAESMPVNVVEVPQQKPQPVEVPVVEKQPVKVVEKQAPVVKKEPVQEKLGTPVRVVEDRKDVTFNPEKPVVKTEAPKKVTKSATTQQAKVAKKTSVKKSQNIAKKANWYVQFGSYSTRAAAEKAQRQIQSAHKNLFVGKQFVILAAVLPNGTTTYRLRIAFDSSNEANGFCRNAKSDGLDCYVAK